MEHWVGVAGEASGNQFTAVYASSPYCNDKFDWNMQWDLGWTGRVCCDGWSHCRICWVLGWNVVEQAEGPGYRSVGPV